MGVVVVEVGVAVVGGIRRGRPANALGVRTREVKQWGEKVRFLCCHAHIETKCWDEFY